MLNRPGRLLVLVAVAAVLAGCGLLGGRSEEPAPTGPLERSSLTVGVLPTVEIGPLQLAIRQGLFAAEGLSVNVVLAANGPATLAGIGSGEYDIAYSSYVPFILAKVKGAVDVVLVADNSFAAPMTAMLVTPSGSAIRTVQDVAGKRVAVVGINTSADLLVKSTLDTNVVDWAGIQWIELPFTQMTAALARGDVDAAMLVEPFITQAGREIGAMPLLDLASGPVNEFPFTAYGANKRFVEAHPNTIAAFQRVMAQASVEALDRSKIEPLLPEFAKVDHDTAKLVRLPGFRSTLDATRVQRVADLMLQFGVLDEPFDVAPMLLPPPVLSSVATSPT